MGIEGSLPIGKAAGA